MSLGELVEQEGEWLLTMELVRGVDFLRYVRQEPQEGQAPGAASTLEGTPSGSAEQSTQVVGPPSGEQSLHVPGAMEGSGPGLAPVRPFHEERLRQCLLQRGQDAHWELGALWSLEQPTMLWMGDFQSLRERRELPLAEARQRGELHTLVALELSCTGHLQLQEDDVQGARQSAEQALALLKEKDLGIPYTNYVVTHLHADLYEGKGTQALARLTEVWPHLKRYGLFRLPMVLASMRFLRARASLLAASQPGVDSQALLRSAQADAQAMERSGLPAFVSFAQLVHACLAAMRGAPNAPELCGRAATSLEAQGLGFHAACLRWCQGTLLGGEQGRVFLEAGQRWMSQQAIRRPLSMLNLSTPGVLPSLHRPATSPHAPGG